MSGKKLEKYKLMINPFGHPITERDWVEDFKHENGNYRNLCLTCNGEFFGHKRRLSCKSCSTSASQHSEGKTLGLTLEECKDQIAQKYGYKSFEEFDDKLTFGRETEIYNTIKFIDDVAQLYAQQPGREWIKCEDRLPGDGKTVLVTDGKRVKEVWFGQRTKKDIPNFRFTTMSPDTITHWMPLPEPPKP